MESEFAFARTLGRRMVLAFLILVWVILPEAGNALDFGPEWMRFVNSPLASKIWFWGGFLVFGGLLVTKWDAKEVA